jgi:putative FmdB family regulatory protein
MPIYDMECDHCDEVFEDIIAHIYEVVPCPNCKRVLERMMSPVNFNMGVGAYGYYDETLEKYIPTNKARREEMKKQGVTPRGETPKPYGDAWV